MAGSILKKISNIIAEEYEVFACLSLTSRLAAVLGLTLFYFSFVIITHLTLAPYLLNTVKSTVTLVTLYLYVLIMAVLNILPILFPNLKVKASMAIFAVLSLNFFPLVPLAFLLPPLRKYKRVVIATTIYLVLCVAGIVIMHDGEEEGFLAGQPENSEVVLWFAGMNAVFMGLMISGYITERISVQKTRIETEIKIAQNIQTQLVPALDIHNDRFRLFGETRPAEEIGGDFFDFVRLSETKVLLAIGDVSGHNIAAGLLMAISKGAFRTALQYSSTLSDLAPVMNRTILENSDKRMFVSFMCAEFDFANNTMTLLNAGHLPLLQYRASGPGIDEIDLGGVAFGLSSQADFQTCTRSFGRGDRFFFITDGIVEATNTSGEQFGFAGLKDLLKNSSGLGQPKQVQNSLFAELTSFTEAQPLHDDATFMAIEIC